MAGLLVVSLAMLTVVECHGSTDAPKIVEDNLDPRIGGRLYSADSPFNQAIPADPQLDPKSAEYVKLLGRSKKEKGFVLALKEWTVPAYFAKPATKRSDVRITGFDEVRRIMRGVPIPDNARPDPAEDAHLSVIDPATRCGYDLYGAEKTATGWTAKWANVTSTADSGIYPSGLSTRATGFAPLAGMIWPAELRNGRIDHALVFAYPYTRSGGPVAPATSSDGKTALASALPQGARVQLDPDLDLDSLDLSAYERTIAEALQRYGMFLGDTGGALALYGVNPQSFDTNPYAGLLPDEPSVPLDKIPVDRFRVLKTGKQLEHKRYSIVPSTCAQIQVIGSRSES
ncbi:hypothetical protein Q0Z83_079150 [Actinoplanes sichuanensis]|uniref:Lipoprotein n=1 Tax=Actinoplanes sichuanensis TaxID=512349 RepID=A0ABW4AEL5_9ACTN|nr:hypothetical protein [Actinoplanes sichuanensis]BEL09724.1 hypothetical protein Q0Z83_079150 [Actinoplanes sichuanensis]